MLAKGGTPVKQRKLETAEGHRSDSVVWGRGNLGRNRLRVAPYPERPGHTPTPPRPGRIGELLEDHGEPEPRLVAVGVVLQGALKTMHGAEEIPGLDALRPFPGPCRDRRITDHIGGGEIDQQPALPNSPNFLLWLSEVGFSVGGRFEVGGLPPAAGSISWLHVVTVGSQSCTTIPLIRIRLGRGSRQVFCKSHAAFAPHLRLPGETN